MGVVVAALLVWLVLALTYIVFVVERAPHRALDPSHVTTNVTPELLKGITEIVSASHKGAADILTASHHSAPTLIVAGAAVAVVWIIAWAYVSVDRNRARRNAPDYRYREPRLADQRREEHRGKLLPAPASDNDHYNH
jgi:hypothetical protein